MIWTESIQQLRGLLSYTTIKVMRLMKCKISELCADLPRLKTRWDQVPKANVLAWHFSHLPRLDRPWQGGLGGNSSLADCDPTDAVLHPQIFLH